MNVFTFTPRNEFYTGPLIIKFLLFQNSATKCMLTFTINLDGRSKVRFVYIYLYRDEQLRKVKEIDHSEAAAIFNEEPSDNIWSQPVEHEDESDTPAFLRRRKKRNKKTEE